MSTYADPSKARVWLDGDAFRGVPNLTPPINPFASSLTGLDPFGGIKAGFSRDVDQDVNRYKIFNKRGTYKTKRDDPQGTLKFRPVDLSKATALTLLRGGTITETAVGSGVWKWSKGVTEQFSLLVRVQDGAQWKAYFMQVAELVKEPPETWDGEDIDGWDLEILDLVPAGGGDSIITYTTDNPLL